MKKLTDRSVLEISGSEAVSFLQGLITNDIAKVCSDKLLYSALLNPKGRFLYDFFIFKNGDKFILDFSGPRIEEIERKLGFYKLRKDVKIERNDKIEVFYNFEDENLPHNSELKAFRDPRDAKMGFRIYGSTNSSLIDDNINYHLRRISLKIAESEHDLSYEKSIISEFDFDRLGAIDYNKGCYIGQELIARTHHLGQVRKKLYYSVVKNSQKIEKNSEISCEGKKVGISLSCVLINDELHILTLIKDGTIEESKEKDLYLGDKKLNIID